MTNKTQIAELKLLVAKAMDDFNPEVKIHTMQLSDLLDQIEAAEARIAEVEANAERVNGWYVKMKTRMLAAEAELAATRGAAVPVAWEFLGDGGKWLSILDPNEATKYGYKVRGLFTNPAPPVAIRSEHAEWSQATFGNVGPVGPLKHLSKEAIEAAETPDDLYEWADMQFLFWDAQRRAGITDEQIHQAMIDKLDINKARTWPEPKDGEPRLHIESADDEE